MKQSQMNGYIMVATIYVVLTAAYGLSAILVFTIAVLLGIALTKINDKLSERKQRNEAR